jgi:rhodanese-related sulfurtransferase
MFARRLCTRANNCTRISIKLINPGGILLPFIQVLLLIYQRDNTGMTLIRQAAFLFTFICVTASIHASDTPDLTKGKIIVPDEIPGVTTLTAEGVIEKANRSDRLVIIDARINKDRAIGYIEESLSLPDINTNCTTLSELVADKQTPLLFYCNGVRCGRSVVAIKIAKSCGYKNLSWFRGGFEEWKQKGYQFLTEEQASTE